MKLQKINLFIAVGLAGAAVATATPSTTQQKTPTLEEQMLSHVEKIVIIDSITVDKESFFTHYRIQPSAGRILNEEEVESEISSISLPDNFEGKPFVGFTNEFNDYMIWSQRDTTGYLRLAESYRLADDSWSRPEFTSKVLNFGTDDFAEESPLTSNAAFPFMSDDGQTLYFASDNPLSLGGYDIFIATKDPMDGTFLIPGNLGMPFNSVYDDYMLVLDRQTGAGWWATDRNQLDGRITIYIFVLTDERTNVDPEDENLERYATLSGWQDLQDEEDLEEAKRVRTEINNIRELNTKEPDFILPMPGGKTYRYYSDFKNRRAASMMQSYLRDEEVLKKKRNELEDLRKQYYETGSNSISARIQDMEKQVLTDEYSLKALKAEIYKEETSK